MKKPLKLEKHKKLQVGSSECHGCVEQVPRVLFKVHPGYPGPVTRSLAKILHYIKKFIIVELYRCMPLLGDEESIPNWVPHIVHYAVVFTNKGNGFKME